jgi:hypothetical protein
VEVYVNVHYCLLRKRAGVVGVWFFFFYQFVKDGVHMRVIQDGHNKYVRTLKKWVEPKFWAGFHNIK